MISLRRSARSRISRSGLVLLAVILVAGALGAHSAWAQGPPLTARNLDPVVQRGDTLVVQIIIGSAANPVGEVNGTGFQLAFDNSALTFLDRQVGGLFADDHPGSTLEIGPFLDGSAVDYSITLGFGVTPPTVTSGEVVRLRFEVKSGAATGSTDLTLSDATRNTSSNPNIPINNLVHGSVTVSETRRAERGSVAPGSIGEGSFELQFGPNSTLALDYSALNAETDVTGTRIVEPLGGTTDLPGGEHRALTAYWSLSQSGASTFTVDVCFALSDLMIATPDAGNLDVFRRTSDSDPWAAQTTELRPNASNPTQVCALDVTSYSQFAVTAPEGHTRTIDGTDGTGNDTGWRSLALPTSAPRIALEDDFDFDVDSGALVQTYDNGQYTGVTDPKTTLERGEGFMLYVFDDAIDTVPGTGRALDLPSSTEDQSTSVTVDGLGINDRFHFLGNPYDVEYSLSGLAGGDLSTQGFQQAVQVWDPNPPGGGQFDVVTQGTPTDMIAAWQSFFVQRDSPGSGQTDLTFDPAGKGDSPGDLRGKATPHALTSALVQLGVEVTASSETVAQDGWHLLFDSRAAHAWDALEATQLAPPRTASYVTMSSPTVRGEALVRRAQASEPVPSDDAPITVPVSVRSVGTAGTATIRWPASERGAVPEDWTVELVDTQTGTTVNLRTGAHTFDVAPGDGAVSDPEDARFRLRVTPSTPIPVELATLEATHDGDAVRLTWRTASETNNAGFNVQRRVEPTTEAVTAWTTVGFVEGSGTTSEPMTYRFTDADVPFAADSIAYRLRQVDTDGTTELSDVVTVALASPDQVEFRSPFPNPARQQAVLRYAVPEPTDVTVAVYDVLGRRVATWVRDRTGTGRHEQTVRLGGLAAGTYFVRLHAGSTVQTRRLTIVR